MLCSNLSLSSRMTEEIREWAVDAWVMGNSFYIAFFCRTDQDSRRIMLRAVVSLIVSSSAFRNRALTILAIFMRIR
jgi:hypothetical protein